MSFEFYIGTDYLDLEDGQEQVLDLCVNDIGDIQGRDGDGTNTIVGKDTNKNRTIFENAGVLIAGTLIPYRRLPARIEKNGNIVNIGYAQLMEAGGVFRLAYRGGNADWFNLIGDKTLRDLDLDEWNHLWTGANVRDARLNNTAWTDAFNYPNVDYGLFADAATIYWYNFYMGMFEKYLIWKIWKEIGFTAVGDFWDNNTDLPKGFIPFCKNWVRDRDYSLRNSGSWDTPSSVFDTDDVWGDSLLAYSLTPTNTLSTGDYNILNPTTPKALTILDECELTIRIRLRFSVSGTGAAYPTMNMLYKDTDGNTQTEVILDPLITIATPTSAGSYTDYDVTVTVNCDRTLIQFVWLAGVSSGAPVSTIPTAQIDIVDYIVNEDNEGYLEITPTFNYITTASTLPDMKQKDLLVHFFNQFCLMFNTDPNTNYINLFSFDTVRNNIPTAKDWSNKLDLSERPSIQFVLNKYAQSNKFRYKDDPNNQYLVARPEFGNGEILIDDENLETDATVFQSEFASIIRQSDTASGTIRMAFIPKFVDDDEADCEPYIGVIEYEDIHLITMDGYSVEATQPAMHEQGFSYLIPLYYAALTDILTQSKIVTCLLRLTSVDINQLDFSVPIWIDHFQAYFYINKISQYNLSRKDSTQVSLVKL